MYIETPRSPGRAFRRCPATLANGSPPAGLQPTRSAVSRAAYISPRASAPHRTAAGFPWYWPRQTVRASEPFGRGAFQAFNAPAAALLDDPRAARITKSACAAVWTTPKPFVRSACSSFDNPCCAGGASLPSATTATCRAADAGSAKSRIPSAAIAAVMPSNLFICPRCMDQLTRSPGVY